MPSYSFSELRQMLDSKEISARELTQQYLDAIPALNQQLNAVSEITTDLALQQADAADIRIASGETSSLTGIPYLHKDIFCVKDQVTTCGSKMLENWVAPYDATVSKRLKEAGAIMIGRANMDEFAMGSSTETSYFGDTKNPWDTTLVPGGSSGGSASGVAAGIAPLSTGTDTGGSIRQPAAFCGITGIKPTYGRVSRYGMIAFASSFDQAGFLGTDIAGCAAGLEAVSGYDSADSTSVDHPTSTLIDSNRTNLKGVTIGVPSDFLGVGLSDEVNSGTEKAIAELERLGATVKTCELKSLPLAMGVYYVLATAECSANLSRYDGVRFGYRAKEPKTLDDLISQSRSEGFGDEVKRRIVLGAFVLSSGYFDAYYLQACKARRVISDDFKSLFQQFDCLLTPTTPHPAFALGSQDRDPITMYLEDKLTNPVNIAGLPALSTPMASTGLPLGLQLIGKPFDEKTLCTVTHLLQQNTDWHLRTPARHVDNGGI